MTRIEINRLEIRVRNTSRDSVDSMINGLGIKLTDMIYNNLYGKLDPTLLENPITIDRLDTGIVRHGSESKTNDLQGTIAESIVTTITGSMTRSQMKSFEKNGIRSRNENAESRGANVPQSKSNMIPSGRVSKQ